MRCLCHFVLIAILLTVIPLAFGQNLSVGGVVGTGLTSDYGGTGTVIRPFPSINSTETVTTQTSLHTFIVGPRVELSFGRGYAVEVDALRRPREWRFTGILTPPVDFGYGPVGSFSSKTTESTWEVPALFKYTLPFSRTERRSSLLVEAGPSLRPFLYRGGSARAGLTTGVGVRWRVLQNLTLEPTVRYTRWGTELNYNRISSAKRDQLEFLVGVSGSPSPFRLSAFGQRLSIGFLGVVGLSGDFPEKEGFSSARSKAVGFALESSVYRRLSVEFDGLYRPRILSEGQRATVLTWEFPLLAKYRFSTSRLTPFIEAGPSFRASGNTNSSNPSTYGITAGAGIERQVGRVRIAPAFRYTYWATDKPGDGFLPQPMTTRKQADVVIGFVF